MGPSMGPVVSRCGAPTLLITQSYRRIRVADLSYFQKVNKKITRHPQKYLFINENRNGPNKENRIMEIYKQNIKEFYRNIINIILNSSGGLAHSKIYELNHRAYRNDLPKDIQPQSNQDLLMYICIFSCKLDA